MLEKLISENKEKLKELERTVGYEFKDTACLLLALTHSSYANEKKG